MANNFLGHLLNSVLTTVGVLGVAFLTGIFNNQTAQVSREPDYVEQLQNRIASLESALQRTQTEVLSLSIKNADLTRLLGGSVEDIQLDGVFTYIDALERPAWCKQIERVPGEKPVFRMRYLNYAYELAYGVSVQKYIGGTDYDNHPKEVADQYYENDMVTYRSKDYEEFIEPISAEEPNAKVYRRQFAKFYVPMPTGPELICGLQINGLPSETLERLLANGGTK